MATMPLKQSLATALVVAFMHCVFASTVAANLSNVSVRQDANRNVTITYNLNGEDAIVAFDIETNAISCAETGWTSIGLEKLRYASGDVFRLVESDGVSKSIRWNPQEAWPGMSVPQGCLRAIVRAYPTNSPPDYMVIDLDSGSATYYEAESELPEGIWSDHYRDKAIVLRRVHAAGRSFLMGTGAHEIGAPDDDSRGYEGVHRVSFTQDYYLGVFEVTCGQFRRVAGGNVTLSQFTLSTDFRTRPVEKMTYATYGADAGVMTDSAWPNDDFNVARKTHANSFFGRLRTLTGLGAALCLPTSAQWEFACRAGSRSQLHGGLNLDVATGSADANLSRFARYKYNSGYVDNGDGTFSAPEAATATIANGTARVGSYEPNEWGFYDMLGNVREMCYDYFYVWSYGEAKVDPSGGRPSNTSYRVLRGGGWDSEPSACRSSAIDRIQIWASTPSVGFRVLLQLP